MPRYREVAEAFIAGLEDRVAQKQPIKRVASVASFFISRIDSLVDPLLDQQQEAKEFAERARGQVGIAGAKAAYQAYKQLFNTDRFKALSAQGAQVQRSLWASTGTKDKAYSDIKCIEALIGKETVNTTPPKTLDAYRDHGKPEARLETNVAEAMQLLKRLGEIGIDLDQLTQQLEDEGVEKHKQYIEEHGEDMPEIRNWKWNLKSRVT